MTCCDPRLRGGIVGRELVASELNVLCCVAFPKEAGTRKLKQAVKRSKRRKQRQKANQAICQRRRKQSYEEFQKEEKSKEKMMCIESLL